MGKNKVMIVGIDGATWDLIKPMINSGLLPTFSKIIENGCHGILNSTIPPHSFVSWTSIFTGVTPAKHGITDLILREGGRLITATTRYRMVDSIWKKLSEEGLYSIVVNDPVTFPPEKINGIMTTGLLTPPKANYCFPPDVKKEIEALVSTYECDVGLKYYDLVVKDKRQAYRLLEIFSSKIHETSLYLARKYDWDVFCTILTSIDRLQHYFWNDDSFLEHHYGIVNKFLESILSVARQKNANLLILSDHGFSGIDVVFNVNSWLIKKGFIHIDQFTNFFLKFQNLVGINLIEELRRLAYILNFDRDKTNKITRLLGLFGNKGMSSGLPDRNLARFIANGIYLNNDINSNLRKRLLFIIKKEMNTLKLGEKQIVKCFEKNEVLKGPFSYRAPDLILVPEKGFDLSFSLSNSIFTKETTKYGARINGSHSPQGIFAAIGPDIKSGSELTSPIQTWDVPATIFHLLGIVKPHYMDGQIIFQILKRLHKYIQ
ncbi:MAG: alkaline phosphatase family protein [Candidatus Hodarchaeota archaeon]